jgi:heat shock protein HtpX
VAAFGISGAVGHGLRKLLMSHPPLEERIQTLRSANVDGSAVRQGLVA